MPESDRGRTVARLLMTVIRMSDGCWHAKLELSQWHAVTPRTILRDFDTLNMAGFTVEAEITAEDDDIRTGRYRLMRTDSFRHVQRFLRPAQSEPPLSARASEMSINAGALGAKRVRG